MPEVHFIGEIVGGLGFEGRNVFAKWNIVSSNDKWSQMHGDIQGRTWLAERSDSAEVASWNHPIDVVYTTSSLIGWPKLYIEVYSSDSYDLIDLVGYGWCHLPTTPGEHSRDIPVTRPAGSWYDELASKFVGGNPRYENTSIVTSTDSRVGHNVISEGTIQIKVEVLMRGFGSNVHFTNKSS